MRRATIFSTALGVYELHLNGARVGRDYLTPGWTDFRARVQYQTHDVTAQVRRGENALGAILGDGWYASVLGYTGRRYFYGGYPRLLAQLEIDYADGTRDNNREQRHVAGGDRSRSGHADLMQGCDLRCAAAAGRLGASRVSTTRRGSRSRPGCARSDPQQSAPVFVHRGGQRGADAHRPRSCRRAR